jgi:hypothetical protein
MSQGVRQWLLNVVAVLLVSSTAMSQKPAPYHEADATIDSVTNWHQLRKWSAKYGKYAFADINEIESEFVVHTLAAHWETLPALAHETSRHQWFLKYVLGHIDATTNYDDLRAIISHSTERCPKKYQTLCAMLHNAASQALAEGIKVTGQLRPNKPSGLTSTLKCNKSDRWR